MTIKHLVLITALAAASLQAYAEPIPEVRGSVAARVERVYVRESAGLYTDEALIRGAAGKERWAEVRFGTPLVDGRSQALVRVPVGTELGRGDVVAARLVAERAWDPAPIPEVSRVTRIVARSGTPLAQRFEAESARRAPSAMLGMLLAEQRSN